MYGFTTVDGFMNVNQSLEEMIGYLANEPSVGLFYIQKHVQNATPNILNLKDKVVERSRETSLHTEDLEDSIVVVKTMSECGLPIADQMIKDINRSLQIMTTSLPRRGLIRNPDWGETATFYPKTSTLSGHMASSSTIQDDLTSRSYLSSVFTSAKQKTASLIRSRYDSSPKEQEFDRSALLSSVPPAAVGNASNFNDSISVELRESCQTKDHQFSTPESSTRRPFSNDKTIGFYEQFTSEREAKLEKWLEES